MAMRSSRLGSAAIRTRGMPCCRWVRWGRCIEPHPAPEDRGERKRRLVDEDLQGLIHLVLTSEIMLGEPDIPQAG